jgi:LCP family protein required for cell wall assembly
LVLDPTIADMDQVITEAFTMASEHEATLFLALIGHGEFRDEDFYLMARDSPEHPNSRQAFELAQRVKELLGEHSLLDGLVLLIDTCHAGVAAEQAGQRWVHVVGLAGRRFELLTASDLRAAANGCFSRSLVEMLKSGRPELGERLYCADIKDAIDSLCPHQTATHLTFNGRRYTPIGDDGLWLATNPALTWKESALAGSAFTTLVDDLTRWYKPTAELGKVVSACLAGHARRIVVTGRQGSGKSTLLAALARPNLAEDIVPRRFLDAVVFMNEHNTPAYLAQEISEQLHRRVVGFSATTEAWRRQVPEEEWTRIDEFERRLLGPLRLLSDERPVRISVDSADARDDVAAALERLAIDPQLAHVQLITTALPGRPAPASAHVIELGPATDHVLDMYAQRRGLTQQLSRELTSHADGDWLTASAIANAVSTAKERTAPISVSAAYDAILRAAGVEEPNDGEAIRTILTILAATGSGPTLPISLLCSASPRLGGPHELARLHDLVLRLTGLIIRGHAGTSYEMVGLTHPTVREHVWQRGLTTVSRSAAHAALAEAIAETAPLTKRDPHHPEHIYAAEMESEHLWQAGRPESAFEILNSRHPPTPADTCNAWSRWAARAEMDFGPSHPLTQLAHTQLTTWKAKAGDTTSEISGTSPKLSPTRPPALNWRRTATIARRTIVALLSIAVLALTGLLWNPTPVAEITNILLIGLDSRTDMQGSPLPIDILKELRTEATTQSNTDTIIVLQVPKNGAKVHASSIPRGTLLPIPGYREAKIEVAYEDAKARKKTQLQNEGITDLPRLERESDQAGRQVLVESVQQLSGLHIDHYAATNLFGFFWLTKSIGGVEVCLNHATSDSDSGANFPAGPQIISGADALSFVRQRNKIPGGDLGRIKRQQAFMEAVTDKVLSAGTLTNPGKLYELIEIAKRYLVFDEAWDLLGFARQMQNIASGNVEFGTIPFTGASDDSIIVDTARVHEYFADLQRGPTPQVTHTAMRKISCVD